MWDPSLCEREMRYLYLIFAPDALNTASKFRCVRAILEREREIRDKGGCVCEG